MAKQLVPSAVLATPDGSQQGLQGEYVLPSGPNPVTVTRVDAQLNFIWYNQCFVVSPLADVRTQLADQLYAVASDASTLARWEAEPGTNPEHWQVHWALLESLDVTRHKNWAQLLVAHPALLQDCANWAAASVYSRCRFGAPDEALQVVGLWAQLHSDESPVLAVDFYLANRRVYRELSRQMVSAVSGASGPLRPGLSDLARWPVRAGRGLHARVWVLGRRAHRTVGGPARGAPGGRTTHRGPPGELAAGGAEAEEIRRSPPYEHWLTVDRFLAGRGWIEEACLVAQSEPVRLRLPGVGCPVDGRGATGRGAAACWTPRPAGAPAPSRPRRWPSGAGNWTPSAKSWKNIERSRKPRPRTPIARDCARYQRATDAGDAPAARATRICFPPPVPARSNRPEKK